MSIEALTKFLDANPEVAKKVAACQNYNEVAEIAKANNFNVMGAELTKYAAEQTAELSDADLEAVAGGAWNHPDTEKLIQAPSTFNDLPQDVRANILISIMAK